MKICEFYVKIQYVFLYKNPKINTVEYFIEILYTLRNVSDLFIFVRFYV